MDVAQRVSGPLRDMTDGAEVDLDVRQQSIEAVAVEAAQDIVARLTPAKITKPQVNRAVKGALADA